MSLILDDDDSTQKSKSSKKKTLGEMSKNELKQFILDEDLDIVVKRADDEESILDKIEAEIGLTEDDYPEDVQDGNSSNDANDEPFEEENEEEEEEETPRRRRQRRTRG